jgi:hypothetical protein
MTSSAFRETLAAVLEDSNNKWQHWVLDFVCNYLVKNHDYGPLSTIFKDLKCSDASIAYCHGRADESDDSLAAVILTILFQMTMEQRECLLKVLPFGNDDAAQSAAWQDYFREWKNTYCNQSPAKGSEE